MANVDLILVAHGSRNGDGLEALEEFRADIEREIGPHQVILALMEFGAPSLSEALENLISGGARHIRVLPLFMAAGKHVARDIPEKIREISLKYPHTKIEMLPMISEFPEVRQVMQNIAAGAVKP